MPATKAPIFGRVENPEQLNLSPFQFTLAGYRETSEGRKEELFEFTVKGAQPFQKHLELIQAATEESEMTFARSVEFISEALLDDAEREKFHETLALPDIYFEQNVLARISNWLLETYAGRPTQPRSASSSSRSRGGRRSSGAGSARAGVTSGDSRHGKR